MKLSASPSPPCRPNWWGLILLICSLIFVPGVAAHAPFSGSAIARILPERIDLEITLNESDALTLCRTCSTHDGPIQPLSLRANQPALAETGSTLFELMAGGQKLVPNDALASLNTERDLVFRVRYPRPPGTIRFQATYMSQQPEKGANSLLLVFASTNETLIGQKLLTPSNPGYEVADPSDLKVAGFVGVTQTDRPPVSTIVRRYFVIGFETFVRRGHHLIFVFALWTTCFTRRKIVCAILRQSAGYVLFLPVAAHGWLGVSHRVFDLVLVISSAAFAIALWQTAGNARFNLPLVALFYGSIDGLGGGELLQSLNTIGSFTQWAVAVFSFDSGMLSGLFAFAILAVPVLDWLVKRPWFETRGIWWLFGAASVAGALRLGLGAFRF